MPCKLLPPSTWGKLRSSSISPASIRRTYAERHSWQLDRAVPPPPSFRRFSTTAATSQGADAEAARVRALAAQKDFLTLVRTRAISDDHSTPVRRVEHRGHGMEARREVRHACRLSKACASYLSHTSDTQIACASNRWLASRNGWRARRD